MFNSEALILKGFAEHNLPFFMALVLIEVSEMPTGNKKVLNHASLKSKGVCGPGNPLKSGVLSSTKSKNCRFLFNDRFPDNFVYS